MTDRQPQFEPFEDDAGEARFRLVGANGEKMLASEPYASKANAVRGIADAKVAVLRTVEGDLAEVLATELPDVEDPPALAAAIVEALDRGLHND
jgi:uncharacterized protein YegP (UPF0339 family)